MRTPRNILFCVVLVVLVATRLHAADRGALRAGAARVEITSVKASLPATGRYEHEKVYALS